MKLFSSESERFATIAPNDLNLYIKYSEIHWGGGRLIDVKCPYAKLIHEKGNILIREMLETFNTNVDKLKYLKDVSKNLNETLEEFKIQFDNIDKSNISLSVAKEKFSSLYLYEPSLKRQLEEISNIKKDIEESVSKVEFPFQPKLIGKGTLLGLFVKCLTEGEFKHLPPLKEKDFEEIIKPYNLKDAKNVFQYFNFNGDKNPLNNAKNKEIIKEILKKGNYKQALDYLEKLKHK